MHELSYVNELYKRVKLHAVEHKAKQVYTIHLSVSILSGLDVDSINFYWKNMNKSMVLLHSTVIVQQEPAHLICQTCNTQFIVNEYTDSMIRCIHCDSFKTIVSEEIVMRIKNIEMECEE